MATTLENTLIRFNDGTTQSTAATTPPAASTSVAGIVQLSTATNSTSTTLAATASAVKAAYDRAAEIAAGTDAQKIAIGAFAAPAAGGNVVLRIQDPEASGTGENARGLGIATCLVPGVITISADLRVSNNNYSARIQIVKNGALVSTLSHNGTTYATKTANVTLALGDRIELQLSTTFAGTGVIGYARNVRALSASTMFALA